MVEVVEVVGKVEVVGVVGVNNMFFTLHTKPRNQQHTTLKLMPLLFHPFQQQNTNKTRERHDTP
jgi:hypothetical protein